MKRKKLKAPQRTPDLKFGGGSNWSVVKIFADGREQVMASNLTITQAQHLGDHFLVGCLEGEKISLRDAVHFGF